MKQHFYPEIMFLLALAASTERKYIFSFFFFLVIYAPNICSMNYTDYRVNLTLHKRFLNQRSDWEPVRAQRLGTSNWYEKDDRILPCFESVALQFPMLLKNFFDASNVIFYLIVQKLVTSDITGNNWYFVPLAPPLLGNLEQAQITTSIWVLSTYGAAVITGFVISKTQP